jgi:hypothetical protein
MATGCALQQCFAGATPEWGSVLRCWAFLVWCGCTGRWSAAVLAGASGCVVWRTLVRGGCPLLHRIREFRVKERYLPSADYPGAPAGTCLPGSSQDAAWVRRSPGGGHPGCLSTLGRGIAITWELTFDRVGGTVWSVSDSLMPARDGTLRILVDQQRE